MPLLRAVPVMLSAGERATLNKRVRGATTAYRDRLRAQIVLAAVRGHPNARIAAGLGISVDTVRKWRGRFAARGLDGLQRRYAKRHGTQAPQHPSVTTDQLLPITGSRGAFRLRAGHA
jgi:DNA-directed RNA polymerase specialized sigma24 family protein